MTCPSHTTGEVVGLRFEPVSCQIPEPVVLTLASVYTEPWKERGLLGWLNISAQQAMELRKGSLESSWCWVSEGRAQVPRVECLPGAEPPGWSCTEVESVI